MSCCNEALNHIIYAAVTKSGTATTCKKCGKAWPTPAK